MSPDPAHFQRPHTEFKRVNFDHDDSSPFVTRDLLHRYLAEPQHSFR